MNRLTLGGALIMLALIAAASFSAIELNSRAGQSTTSTLTTTSGPPTPPPTTAITVTSSTQSQAQSTTVAEVATTQSAAQQTSSSSSSSTSSLSSSTAASTTDTTQSTQTTVSSSSHPSSTSSTTATSTLSTTTSSAVPPTYQLVVSAELPDGTQIPGLTAEYALGGQPAVSSPLPANFSLTAGESFVITAVPIKGYSFAGWSQSDGNSTTFTMTALQNTTLVAFYKPLGIQTLQVRGALLNGKSVVGISLDVVDHQLQTASARSVDTIPDNLTGMAGDSYTVTALSTAVVVFRDWNNNPALDNATIDLTLAKNTTATAYFQLLQIPFKVSGPGNHTITVIAHTMDGGLVVGAYFQVRINGVWDDVADGYAPASVTVPNGNEELVMYHCAETQGCEDKFFVYRYYNNTSPHILTRWQYINLNSDMVVNSFYDVLPASEAVHVTIEATDTSSGQPIFVNCTCGSLVTIDNLGGTAVAQSLEPYSFWVIRGDTYTVTVGDLPGYTFEGWSNGASGYTMTFTAMPQPGASDPYYQYFSALYEK